MLYFLFCHIYYRLQYLKLYHTNQPIIKITSQKIANSIYNIYCILFSLKAKYIYTFLPTTFSYTLHCRHSSSLGKTSALIGFVNQGFKRPLALLYFRYGNTTLPSIYYIYIFVLPINPMMMVHYWNRSVFWCGVLFVCSFGIFFLL